MNSTEIKTPCSIEAEEYVLGSLLLDASSLNKVIDILKPEHFFLTGHQAIYKACLRLGADGIDFITVIQVLEDSGLLDKIGGRQKITGLLDRTVSAVNIEKFAELIIEKWRRRKLIENAHKLIELGHSDEEWQNIATQIETMFTDVLTSNRGETGLIHLGSILPQLDEELQNRFNTASPTELVNLDNSLNGGFRKKELIVIAGRAAMGKSFVAIEIAKTIAKTGKPVAIFSAEMDNFAVAKRLIGNLSGIEISKLITNKVNTEDEYDLLYKGYELLGNLPIYCDDTPGSKITINYLNNQCLKLKREHGEIGAVIVDYLQLLGDRAALNRASDLGRYSAALKDLSKQLNAPVIALAQINREVESLRDKRPSMSHLKDSGAIEQDADVILSLYREEYYNPDTPDKGILEIGILKNRNGNTGTVKVKFDPVFGKISNLYLPVL